MDKSLVKFAKNGDPSLLVWRVPASLLDEALEEVQIYALPLLSRAGGALYAVPDKVLPSDILLDVMMREEAAVGILGPSREFTARLIVEEDIGSGVVELEETTSFLAIDLDDEALAQMREYDPVTDSTENILPFYEAEPNALPKVTAVLPVILEWIDSVAQERLNFYSAREEQNEPALPSKKAPAKKAGRQTMAGLSAQVQALQQQLQAVVAQQEFQLHQQPSHATGSAGLAIGVANGPLTVKMPPLSGTYTGGTAPKVAASLVGPPPRAKMPSDPAALDVEQPALPIQGGPGLAGEGGMAHALSQQSFALTQLVAHLTGNDPMVDLASGSSGQGLGLNTKGVARREKMQSDLAMRSSSYFLQVQQQLYKRMNPARAVPRTTEELAQADVSMTAYLERYGGFKSCRDTGLIMWIVAHAMDSAAREDFQGTKEYLALLAASMEQRALDGSWNVAYILSLMEEPPQQLFTERLQTVAAAGRPFAPLVPPQWAAVALAYLKEIEVLQTRKSEMRKPPPKASPAKADPSAPAPASPKRKPRFPKKPKADAEEA